jgi:hypothetical protein
MKEKYSYYSILLGNCNFENTHISELVYARELLRKERNWELCDNIRAYLDSKNVFIFDTSNGQEVYYELKGMTREKLVERINSEKRSIKMSDAWLYSTNKKYENSSKKRK